MGAMGLSLAMFSLSMAHGAFALADSTDGCTALGEKEKQHKQNHRHHRP